MNWNKKPYSFLLPLWKKKKKNIIIYFPFHFSLPPFPLFFYCVLSTLTNAKSEWENLIFFWGRAEKEKRKECATAVCSSVLEKSHINSKKTKTQTSSVLHCSGRLSTTSRLKLSLSPWAPRNQLLFRFLFFFLTRREHSTTWRTTNRENDKNSAMQKRQKQ